MIEQRYLEVARRVAANIKAYRIKSGLTQAQAAGRLGIVERQYQKYEQGYSNLTLRTLTTLADAFDVDVRVFFAAY